MASMGGCVWGGGAEEGDMVHACSCERSWVGNDISDSVAKLHPLII